MLAILFTSSPGRFQNLEAFRELHVRQLIELRLERPTQQGKLTNVEHFMKKTRASRSYSPPPAAVVQSNH